MATQVGNDISFQRNVDQNPHEPVEEHDHCVGIEARHPSRVIHFSDGTMEEFSDEEQPDNGGCADKVGEPIDEVRSSQCFAITVMVEFSTNLRIWFVHIRRANSRGDRGCC